MFILLFSITVILILCTMMTLLINLISKKTFMNREKSSPFECGFDPKKLTRLPFSLHFFLIAVIFLIFDVEIVLLLPLIITLKYSNIWSWYIITITFIMILLLGLYHEWNQKALDWII